MNRRREPQATVPRLRHEEAVQYLVEYHFGRLSPRLNAAVEAHIRDCNICQRQGLNHAATEKREVARQLRKVRPGGKKQITGRGRGVILILAVLAILQIGVFELSRGSGSPLGSLFGGSPAHIVASPSATATPTPPPLTSSLTYDQASINTAAVSLSPDGKTLATASATISDSTPTVTLWNTTTGKQSATLSWPGTIAPGVLAWSPDGTTLAAADGALVGVWSLPSTAPAWTLVLPAPPAMRVYDVRAATIHQQPDASTAFANGTLLRWTSTGSLTVASAGAASSLVTASGDQQVDLWRRDGTHLVSDGRGGVEVGVSSSDVAKHAALLSWSPDSHFLLWASLKRPVGLPSQPSAGTPSPSGTATSGASGSAVATPDALVGALASAIAASNQGEALLWFSSDGHLLATCASSSQAAGDLAVYDIASARVVSTLSGACTGLTATSLLWNSSSTALVLAAPGKPIAVFVLAPGVS